MKEKGGGDPSFLSRGEEKGGESLTLPKTSGKKEKKTSLIFYCRLLP